MSLRSTTCRPLVAAALAAGLLAAPAAQARVADEGNRSATQTSSLAGTVSPGQDLRGEMARDAARTDSQAAPVTAPKQDLRGEMARDAARPAPVVTTSGPVEPAPKTVPAGDDDGPQTWLILLGLTGAAIAAAGAAGAVRHRRLA
jgi:hypothetical protein